MFTVGLVFLLVLWNTQTTSASIPESGLEKAAASSAVAAGSDPTGVSSNGQQQTDLETRLKRITDTLHRVRGPELEPSDGRVQSERLVVADRPPPYQSGGSQSPYMMRNDEMASSGDGAVGDDDEGDDGGDFGSGDRDVGFGGPEDVEYPRGSDYGAPTKSTEGVYPADVDEHTTKKPILTTTTRRTAGGRSTSGTSVRKTAVEQDKNSKSHSESEQRHLAPTSKPRATGSSSSYRTLSFVSLWLRLSASLLISFLFWRTFGQRH